MAQGLKYVDAVKLLGGCGPLTKVADNVLGGLLAVGTAGGSEAAISLFDAKTEAIRLGQLMTSKITDVVRGQSRFNRSQRLHAAHGVLVVSSFFASLDDCLSSAGLALPGFSAEDQLLLVSAGEIQGSWQSRLLDAPVPAPSPDLTHDRLLAELTTWYGSLASGLVRHLPGLAVWDTADDRTRRAVERAVTETMPELARARYEEAVRQISMEVPEFAIWMSQSESRAVSRGLESLEATLIRVTSKRAPARQRADLAVVYRGDLDEPILRGYVGELTMPSLGTAYLDPRFRARAAVSGNRAADEDWWRDTVVRDDFGTFLATYLTTPQAAVAPMLLLGQPGAGKSSLTRILAARLPAADYLVVRVVLREVRAEAPIQDQIEQALRDTIGETVSWPDLARDADAAMPVILLDGLDELLQVTGVHQSDYLERVAAFQQREALLGRPAAVLVTSRTAVADRARLPAGSVAARLEPFDTRQVDRWLTTWNGINDGYWNRTGRRPLSREVVLRFPDLATQPLLMLMLALYDATANSLQETEGFDICGLYEGLLHEFAEREVRRVHGGNLLENILDELVEEELLRLSVVAFAMFHRLRLWVTTEELDADLAGLDLRPSGNPRTESFQRAFTAGQEMVGRFFFIQRAQAFQEDQTRRTYEFLHATFGEFLVARLVVRAVREGAALARIRTVRTTGSGDDDLLRSLLGYTPLCARNTVLPFLGTLLSRSEPGALRDWAVDRLRVAVNRPTWTPQAYQPVEKRVDHWMATYSFNLLMIALACGQPVRASELYQHATDPAGWLRDMALQWRAAVPGGMYFDALETMRVTRDRLPDGRRDLLLERGTEAAVPLPVVDPAWAFSFGPSWSFDHTDENSEYFPMSTALRSMDLSSAFADDVVRHAVDPLIERLPLQSFVTFVPHDTSGPESVAHSLVRLALMSGATERSEDLLLAYWRAQRAIGRFGHVGDDRTLLVTILLRALTADARLLPSAEVYRLVAFCYRGRREAYLGDEQAILALECLAAARVRPLEPYDDLAARLVRRVGGYRNVLSPNVCLRLLTVLPITRAWRLRRLLVAIDENLRGPEAVELLRTDPDFAARISAARARFDGYTEDD